MFQVVVTRGIALVHPKSDLCYLISDDVTENHYLTNLF